jgi:hypothetical protein
VAFKVDVVDLLLLLIIDFNIIVTASKGFALGPEHSHRHVVELLRT